MSALQTCLMLRKCSLLWRTCQTSAVYSCSTIYSRKQPHCRFHSHIQGTRGQIPAEFEDIKFKTIFLFPHIRFARTIARMKLYQTGFTMLAVPSVCAGYSAQYIDLVAVQAVLGAAAVAGIMLYLMGSIIRRLVGIIAVDETMNYARLSRLTFWGNRRDIYLPIQSIVPLSDYCINPWDTYIKLMTYDSPDELYLSIRYGGIKDMNAFQQVFGSIDEHYQWI